MKTLFRLIAFALCAQCFGADAANDIILVQRNSGNTGPVQRNVPPVATGLLGTDGSKVPAPVVVGANLTLSGNPLTLSASASGGAGNRVSDTITQLSHGFSVGQVLYNNNGTFAKAKADAIGTSYALGVVESVTTNTFVIVYQGSITLSGLTTSSLYYLSDATAGAMTTTAPTTTTSFLEPVLRTGTATQAYVDVGSPVSLSKVDLAANVTGFLPSANGGLGVDAHTWTGIEDWTSGTPTIHAGVNGRIPIGNTTSGGFDWTTLTQGSGITIANAAGSITITATGSGSGNVTSAASLTANAVVLGSGTQGIETLASLGNSGAPLLSQGSGKPVFGALNLAGGSSIVTGANPVGTGGTGATTLTAHGIVIGNSTGTVNVTAAGTAGQLARSGGASADPGWTTPTFPNTATANKILVGDGTNIVLSTPTFPNASATSGKIIKSDGTNWIASTETYAVPGTSGNVLVSDGTNWTSLGSSGTWADAASP